MTKVYFYINNKFWKNDIYFYNIEANYINCIILVKNICSNLPLEEHLRFFLSNERIVISNDPSPDEKPHKEYDAFLNNPNIHISDSNFLYYYNINKINRFQLLDFD